MNPSNTTSTPRPSVSDWPVRAEQIICPPASRDPHVSLKEVTLPSIPTEVTKSDAATSNSSSSQSVSRLREIINSIVLTPIPDGVKLTPSQKVTNILLHISHIAVLGLNAAAYIGAAGMTILSIAGLAKAMRWTNFGAVIAHSVNVFIGFGIGVLSSKMFGGFIIDSHKRHADFVRSITSPSQERCLCGRSTAPTLRQVCAAFGLASVTSNDFENLKPLTPITSLGLRALQVAGAAVCLAAIGVTAYAVRAGLTVPEGTRTPAFLISILDIVTGGIVGNLGVRLGSAITSLGLKKRFENEKIKFRISPGEQE